LLSIDIFSGDSLYFVRRRRRGQVAIEGLDAAVLIENTGFVPLAELPKAQGAEVGPTLDAALAEARLSDRRVERRETLLDRLEMLKADLWVSPAFQIRRAMPQESVAMTPSSH